MPPLPLKNKFQEPLDKLITQNQGVPLPNRNSYGMVQ